MDDMTTSWRRSLRRSLRSSWRSNMRRINSRSLPKMKKNKPEISKYVFWTCQWWIRNWTNLFFSLKPWVVIRLATYSPVHSSLLMFWLFLGWRLISRFFSFLVSLIVNFFLPGWSGSVIFHEFYSFLAMIYRCFRDYYMYLKCVLECFQVHVRFGELWWFWGLWSLLRYRTAQMRQMFSYGWRASPGAIEPMFVFKIELWVSFPMPLVWGQFNG